MSQGIRYSYTIILIIVSCCLTYFINQYLIYKIQKTTDTTINSIEKDNSDLALDMDFQPYRTYQFIKPTIKREPKNESLVFTGLKKKLNAYIESLIISHKLVSASIYLRYYGHGALMNLNPYESYSPGSMLKIFNLIFYLKLNEQTPGLLDKKMVYTIPTYSIPIQTFNSKQIEEGKQYTIKELLRYMIVYSDNKATCWLVENLGSDVYFKMMNELNIPMQQTEEGMPKMTAFEYSEIIKMLYNSSYLSCENSEYALGLLNKSDFTIGLVNGLPEKRMVVHKFGESGTKANPELHESGLVYMDYGPYLITIMTKGYNIQELPPVISNISKMVYDDISKIEE